MVVAFYFLECKRQVEYNSGMVDYKSLDPQSLILRPLSKGMLTNIPTQMIPPGAGVNVFNFDIDTAGLRSCSQWKPYHNPPNFYGIPLDTGEYILDIIPYFTIGSGTQLLALSNKKLRRTSDGKSWEEVGLNPSGSFNFTVSKPFTIQWCASASEVYFVDSSTATGIMVYNGYYLRREDPFDEQNNPVFNGATTIAYINDRLVCGNTGESDGTQRVRWSSTLNKFLFRQTDYADLVQGNGMVQKITSYEDYPVVFLDDGIYFGQPYGYDASLATAWIFRPLESGGNSVVGPRAFVRVIGGIAFAGRDDFFYINALKRTEKGDFTIESMKCPVLRETLRNTAIKAAISNTIMMYDSHHKRVIVGMSTDASVQGVNKFAAYHTETNAWSMFATPLATVTSLQDISTDLAKHWSDIADGYSWADYINDTNGSWYAELAGFSASRIIAVGMDGILYTLVRELGVSRMAVGSTEEVQTTVAIYETGDMDLDVPDNNKIAFKLTARVGEIEFARSESLIFMVEGSTNKGRTWKHLGQVVITPEEDEEEIHFRLAGTNLRFRLTFTSNSRDATPFLLEELTIRVRGGAQQVVRGGTQGD